VIVLSDFESGSESKYHSSGVIGKRRIARTKEGDLLQLITVLLPQTIRGNGENQQQYHDELQCVLMCDTTPSPVSNRLPATQNVERIGYTRVSQTENDEKDLYEAICNELSDVLLRDGSTLFCVVDQKGYLLFSNKTTNEQLFGIVDNNFSEGKHINSLLQNSYDPSTTLLNKLFRERDAFYNSNKSDQRFQEYQNYAPASTPTGKTEINEGWVVMSMQFWKNFIIF